MKRFLLLGFALALAPLGTASAGFHVLYTFHGGADGGAPAQGLVLGNQGNFYGTTTQGGTGCGAVGCGVVFKLDPSRGESVVYAFQGGADGEQPQADLIRDRNGNLYGTTFKGGHACGGNGCGVVFKLAPDGTKTDLHVFQNKKDGWAPNPKLLRDKSGNVYGTAFGGANGFGIVYKISNIGTYSILHSFSGPPDGAYPLADVIMDRDGNLIGTTTMGGQVDNGAVFKLAPDGSESVLYSFGGKSDGRNPATGLYRDRQGNLFGPTYRGGTADLGTIFELAPDGIESVLYSFTGPPDGAYPISNLVIDRNDNFYGTTYMGGHNGFGTVYKFDPSSGTETVLHAFTGDADGANPFGNLIQDDQRRLTGTTLEGGDQAGCGGSGCGTVWQIHE